MSHQPTPQTRRLRSQAGRIGAYIQHSRYDPRETTRAARFAFNQRFVEQVDPGRKLSEPERFRRATAAKKAYFARLALASAKARAKRPRRGHGTLSGGAA